MKDLSTLDYLIVEDAQTDYLLIEEMFAELGVEEGQLTWVDCLSQTPERKFDVVLCDLNLPDSTRAETIVNLRAKFAHAPIIALTGISELDFATETIHEGAQDFLVKGSFDAAQLFKSISFSLERQALREELHNSHLQYEQIFNHNPLPHLVYDVSTLNILKANRAALNLYGYTAEELCAMTIMDIRPASEVDHTKRALKRYLEKNHPNDPETFIHLTKNGKKLYVEVTIQAYKEEDNNRVIAAIKDITEKVETEQELQQSELRFEYATRATSDIIYDWDLTTNRLEWKGKSIKMFYDDNGPLNIQQWISRMHPEDRSSFTNLTNDVLNDGQLLEGWETEYRLRDKSNGYRHVQDRAIVLHDTNNNPVRIIGALEDISEKIKAKNTLIQSEKRYTLYFRDSPLPKFLCKASDFSIHETNGKADQLIKMTGRSCPYFYQLFDGHDFQSLKKVVCDNKEGKYSNLGTWQVALSPNRPSLIYSVAMHPVELEGDNFILFICTDVTELERTKQSLQNYIQRYKLVLEATNDAIWDYDVTTGKLLWGDNFTELFGHDIKKVNRIEAWADCVHPDDREDVVNSFNAALKGSRQKWQGHYRFLKNDGSYAHVFDQSTFVRNENGDPIRGVGAMQDVTREKERRHQLKLMEKVVASANDPILITEARTNDKQALSIIYANDAFLNQSGYSRDEVLGNTPKMFQGPKTDQRKLDELKSAMDNWQPCQIEVANYKKNGEEFWVEFSVVPIADDKGWYTHWISIQRETTARVKKEEVREVFHRMNIAVSRELDLDARYNAVLKEIIRYTGFEIAEGWITNIDNTLLTKVTTCIKSPAFEGFIRNGAFFNKARPGEGLPGAVWERNEIVIWDNLTAHEEFIRTEAAKVSGINTSIAVPIYRDKSLVGVINLFSTKQRVEIRPFENFLSKISHRLGPELKRLKIEDEQKTILHLSPNWLFITDTSGVIKKGNAALAGSLSCKEEDCVGLLFEGIIPKQYHSEFYQFLDKLVRVKSSLEVDIAVLLEGQLHWMNLTAVYHQNDDLIYLVGKDISEEKNLENLLYRAHEMARIGTWEVNLTKNTIYWSPMTKEIHEVDKDYIPKLETAIHFYKEGASRDLVKQNVEQAINGEIEGWEFDAQLVTAKGKTIWVRAQGEVERIDGKVIRVYGSFQDIDHRKRSEKRLAETNMRYGLASKAAAIGIWDWDVVQDKLLWDETMMSLYGIKPERFEGAYVAWQNGLHPDDREEENKKMQRALEGKEEFNTQFRVVFPDSEEVRYLRAFAQVERDEEGNPLRMVGVNYDVTEQVLHQSKVEKANREREDILESITDGFFSVDHNWNITYWNKAAEVMLQRPRNEILGKNLWDMYEDATQLKFYKEYHKVMKEQAARRFVEYYPTLDIWVEVSAYPKENGLAVYFKNITERVKREKQLADLKLLQEHVINSTSDLIWATNPQFNLILANQAYLAEMEQVSGRKYELGQPVISTTDQDWAFDEQRKQLWQKKYKGALNGREQYFMLSVQGNLPTVKTYQIALYPIKSSTDEGIEITGVACFAKDITERENHIQAIEEQNKKLKDIAWTQSHVVRAPVARIMALTEMISFKEVEDQELKELLHYITISSEELDGVIRDITAKTQTIKL